MTRVVVSVGTDHHLFDRMLDWMLQAQQRLDLDVFVQRGATAPVEGLQSVDFLGADDLAELMRGADAVVCHGGPGTISLARNSGHRPIVIARNPAFGEHIDDHQMRYVARLAAETRVDSATSVDHLVDLLSNPRPTIADAHDDGEAARTVDRFGELVGQLVAGTLPKRTWRDRLQLRREA